RQILLSETNLLHRCCVGCIRKVSHILQYAPSFPSFAALPQRKIFRSRKSVINAEIVVFSIRQNIFGVVRLSLTVH
ncbi:hypothetical protein, partial [Klebsiella oxytoca]|uniref:hypothetical protein n=1 Tax=Klebsiella oxytoca TaxID=571 RepID=UPI00398356C0